MTDLYQSVFVDRWPWWAGGAVIGLLVPMLYLMHNTALGVSTGYGTILKALRPRTRLWWLNTSTFADRWGWRLFFVGGMIGGAFVSARLAGMPLTTTEMGIFTANISWSFADSGVFFFLGGLLLAFGARISGGCTSGHSIHGLANRHLSSLVATVFFFGFGVLATWWVRTYLLGGGV